MSNEICDDAKPCSPEPVRLTSLICSPDSALCDLLVSSLGGKGFEVLCAARTGAVEASIRCVLPDVLILDWGPGADDCLPLVQRLRANLRTRDVPVILISAQADESATVQGLDAGADDYLVKPLSIRELMARLRAVLRRRAPHLAAEAIEVGSLVLNPVSHQIFADGQSIHLGPTDFRLLSFLMSHPERMYTRRQLLDEVWGDHIYVSERTVDVHIRNLRAGLRASGHHRRVETVRGGGYRFRVD